jgi:dolichyl-phosphate-mannose-protein mannosyltransferase
MAILAVTAIAAGVRTWGLSRPPELVFDENYYAVAACIYVGGSDETCRVDEQNERLFREQQWDVGSYVHPPLGKWTIALGVKAFGMEPFGWRIGSAVTGTLAVTAAAIMAQLLFGSVLWTFVAGLLLATEHLSVVLSRLALLDVHLQFWVVLGLLFLVLDRRWIDRRSPREPPEGSPARAVPSPLWRPWRNAAGAALGAAFAVKWSGVLAILAALVISIVWETTRRRRPDGSRGAAFASALSRESFGLLLAFLMLPLVVYVVAYLPWLNHFGWDVGRLIDTQVGAAEFHLNLRATALDPDTGEMTPTHYAYSRPWTWFLMTRPIRIASTDVGAAGRGIVAIGNPVIFWGSVWSLPYLAIAWWRKREWVASFLLLAVLVQYVPWLIVARPQFFFYVAPFVPFLVLGFTYLLRDLADARLIVRDPDGRVATDPGTGRPAVSTSHPYRPIAVAAIIASVALFVWFFPVLTWITITDAHERLILWFPGWR